MSASRIKSVAMPALVLGCALAASGVAVCFSLYSQNRDKAEMRKGVERDKEMLRQRRREMREQRQRDGQP